MRVANSQRVLAANVCKSNSNNRAANRNMRNLAKRNVGKRNTAESVPNRHGRSSPGTGPLRLRSLRARHKACRKQKGGRDKESETTGFEYLCRQNILLRHAGL